MALLEALADCRTRLVAHLRDIADDLEAQEVPADLEPEDCWRPDEFGAAFAGWLLEAVHEFGFTIGYKAGQENQPVKHTKPGLFSDRLVPQDDRQTSMELEEAQDD